MAMTPAERLRKFRAAKKAQNICSTCLDRQAEAGLKSCRQCIDARRVDPDITPHTCAARGGTILHVGRILDPHCARCVEIHREEHPEEFLGETVDIVSE